MSAVRQVSQPLKMLPRSAEVVSYNNSSSRVVVPPSLLHHTVLRRGLLIAHSQSNWKHGAHEQDVPNYLDRHFEPATLTRAAIQLTWPLSSKSKQAIIPASCRNPGIPAQQMQRTGMRERACGSGTGQNPLAEHAHIAPQPRSIAWGGGGEAAMKGVVAMC